VRDGRRPRRPATRYASAVLAVVATFSSLGARCGTDPCSEGPGFDNTIASARRWILVVSSPMTPTGEGTVDVAMRVADVNATGTEDAPHDETIAVHSTFLPGIDAGMSNESDVFLAMSSKNPSKAQVSSVVVRDAEGSHHFEGLCAAEGEELLRRRLGDRYDATIEALIGLTGRQRILALLEARAA
jgi:hypothetical protein